MAAPPGSLEYEELLAPENFSMVTRGIYRSAFPRSKNLIFLKRLGLKTVIPLVKSLNYLMRESLLNQLFIVLHYVNDGVLGT